jgi:dTDP-4-amino-4,6-dideoxygalactose transaminase
MKIFKKPVFVSISPNAENDDVWLALKLIFTPWLWLNGKAIACFTEQLKQYLGVKYVFTLDSGRNALFTILKACGVGDGDEVLLQSLTCTAVVNPILWSGARPVYVDIDEESYNISVSDLVKKIKPQKSRVLIIQHTFGLPANLDDILVIAKKYNLLVIEDVAHALGAEWKDKKVGTFGDVSILSFGRFKIISTVFGGAIITNNAFIAEKLQKVYDGYQFPPYFWIFEQLFHPILLAIAKPLYNFFGLGKILVILAKKLKLISLSVSSIEKVGGRSIIGPARLPNALALLGINQLKKIERFNNHRRYLADLYRKELRSIEIINFPKVLENAFPVYLYFPIQLRDYSLATLLIKEGKKREGLYLETWPASNRKVVGPQGVNLQKLQYSEGSCPLAEKVSLGLIVLPTHPNIREKDAWRVINFIKFFYDTRLV